MARLATKCQITVAVIAVLSIILGILIWATFPPIYKALVNQNMRFSQNNDYSLGYSAFLFTNPPMKNLMRFYFFNVTNPDEILYSGAKPELVEVGAYAFVETEQKKYIDFNEDKSQMFYQNYKKYIMSPSESSPGVSFDDQIVFPNPTATGAVATMENPDNNMTKVGKVITSIGLLFLGEYPFISKKVHELIFDGYNDALLDLAHSELLYMLGIFLNNGKSIIPVPIPDMTTFAYMNGYNNTYDENFEVRTGTTDIDKLGEIVSWGGLSELPETFWPTPYARQIRGSDSGSFCKLRLKESDKLPFFLSFMCRSFTKTYSKRAEIKGIPTMEFEVAYEDFDTTTGDNIGFRYSNPEKVNYYPQWPGCDNVYCHDQCKSDSCRFCCGRNIVNGTYLMPPGMFPLVCYPGHLKTPPFNVFYSPPHFLYSPKEVHASVSGLSPDSAKHRPFVYQHEPYSGTVLQVDARLQVNMPVIRSRNAISATNLPNVIIPLFWQDSHTSLSNFVYNKVWLGFVFVPKLMNIIKYCLIAGGLLVVVILVFYKLRHRLPSKNTFKF